MPADSDIATTAPAKPPSFADVLLRIIDHWFGPKADKWHWFRRFVFAFSGSATFFLTWFVYIDIVGGFSSTPDKYPERILIVIISVLFALWFAGITAWKDLSYGPIRLYLSGFLLPYLVWTLIQFMMLRPFLESGA